MRKLLRIDASAQTAGSHSRALGDWFQMRWEGEHPGGEVVRRDPSSVPHLDEGTVAVLYAGGEPGGGPVPPGIAWSDALIAELKAADDVVVTSAVYNFGMPSSLKAWIDHIVRFGHTLAPGGNGAVGLLAGKSACLLTARGGTPETSPDYQGPELQAVFGYLGFSRIDWISLAGTKIPDGRLDARIARARAAVDALFSAKAAA